LPEACFGVDEEAFYSFDQLADAQKSKSFLFFDNGMHVLLKRQ
jgi:hypothetical protein